MGCPRCGNTEFSPDGFCPVCNFKAEIPEAAAEPGAVDTGHGENSPQSPPSAPNGSAVPPWRLELTKRLEALKQEEKAAREKKPVPKETGIPRPHIVQQNTAAKQPVAPPGTAGSIREQKPQPVRPPVSGSSTTVPQQKTIASLGEKVFQPQQSGKSKDIRDLIDSAVSRQTSQSDSDTPIYMSETLVEPENKYILLSRTLSGLIDLIIVVLCTAAFIIAADSFAGIVTLDGISAIEYAVLFLLIFFLYSIFFLAASGQTVGMMITDLRVVGILNSRPSIGQLFIRCFGFLLSVFVFGFGLLWSFFDRKNRCFHDRLSDTSVIRI